MWFVFERYDMGAGPLAGPFNTVQAARVHAEKLANKKPQIIFLIVQAVGEVYSIPTLKFKKLE